METKFCLIDIKKKKAFYTRKPFSLNIFSYCLVSEILINSLSLQKLLKLLFAVHDPVADPKG
jgi:hypothetical protein